MRLSRCFAGCVLMSLVAALAAPALAQAPATRARAASATKQVSPLASQMRAQKVVQDKDGKESMEDASNVTVGETVQYTIQHRNVSQRLLQNIDFGIPIPPGTSYVEGSATPEGAKRVKLDKQRDQFLWRVEKMAPGDEVTMSLRVKIDPDPMLTPTDAGPRKPEFRRQ